MPRRRRRRRRDSYSGSDRSDDSVTKKKNKKADEIFLYLTIAIYIFNFEFHVLMAFMLGILYNTSTSANIVEMIFAYIIPSSLLIIPIFNFIALVIGIIKDLWGGIAGLIVVAIEVVIVYPFWIFYASSRYCCWEAHQSAIPYALHAISIIAMLFFCIDCLVRYVRGISKRAAAMDDYDSDY